MNSKDFFSWCEKHKLDTNQKIAGVVNVSVQTVRNWQSKDNLPVWLSFACIAIENDYIVIPFSVSDFKSWQNRNKITTYEKTGEIFGIKRQAVHQWFRRGKLPKWLGLACIGYDLSQKN